MVNQATSPDTTDTKSSRIAELKMERLTMLDRLAELEHGIQELEHATESCSTAMSDDGAILDDVLDNFGYIRQFSGEPYDYTKAMGVSQS